MSAVSYLVGSSQAAGNSISLPAHQAGDLIFVGAVRNGSATAPTVPAPFRLVNFTGNATQSMSVGCFIATSSASTSGTWTNAVMMIAVVFRAATVITGNATVAQAASTNTLGLSQGFGSGEFVFNGGFHFGFSVVANASATLTSPPSGWTLREVITTSGVNRFALFLGPSSSAGGELLAASMTPGETLTSWRNIAVCVTDTGVSRGSSRPLSPFLSQVIG